jgi:hypothetical protein
VSHPSLPFFSFFTNQAFPPREIPIADRLKALTKYPNPVSNPVCPSGPRSFFLPASHILTFHPYSVHTEKEEVWIWRPSDSEDSAFYFDKREPIRFRVEAEVWHDHTPQKPDFTATVDGEPPAQKPVPYTIIGSVQQPGLGPVHWWEEDADTAVDVDVDDGADADAGVEM